MHKSNTKSADEAIITTKEETFSQRKPLPPIVSAPTVMVSPRNISTSTDNSNDSDTAINTSIDTDLCENTRDLQAPDIVVQAKSRSAHRKRRPSGGKLSHGWTSPQPLVPIVGGALLKNENLQLKDTSLHVDVSELLK